MAFNGFGYGAWKVQNFIGFISQATQKLARMSCRSMNNFIDLSPSLYSIILRVNKLISTQSDKTCS
jgi:hypothetical protein